MKIKVAEVKVFKETIKAIFPRRKQHAQLLEKTTSVIFTGILPNFYAVIVHEADTSVTSEKQKHQSSPWTTRVDERRRNLTTNTKDS